VVLLYLSSLESRMSDSPTETYAWVRRVGTLLSIPLTLGLAPVIGGAIGWALDRFFGTRPFFTLFALAAGFAAGLRETWLMIQRVSHDSDEQNEKSNKSHK